MWIGDRVDILTPKTIKKNKVKMKRVGSGTIIKHISQVGLNDDTSEFLVETDTGESLEITEDFLRPEK